MLNLEHMVNFAREFIIDKNSENINENIYLNLNEISIKFKVHIVQEYERLFDKIQCTSKMKRELKQMNSCFKKILNILNREISKKSCKRKKELNTVFIEEEDIQFKKYAIEDLKNSVLSLDMYYKEFVDIFNNYEKTILKNNICQNNQGISNVRNMKNRPSFEIIDLNKKNLKIDTIKSQEVISNHNQDQEEERFPLDRSFCEKIIKNYKSLFKKYNEEKMKNGTESSILEKIEKYLDSVSSNYFLNFLSKRIRITKKVLKELENINQITYSLYSDKVMEVNKKPVGKKSSFSENIVFSYTSKTGNSQKFSLQFSKIITKPFSNNVSSLFMEMDTVMKDLNQSNHRFLVFKQNSENKEEINFDSDYSDSFSYYKIIAAKDIHNQNKKNIFFNNCCKIF